ncbi:contact-dependent growth inhibition system immunity protein [Klebsiella aerogenes]|uniref:contact-dependent growth inhibition system immunity protein n=1 Tax=Klebsiella aerogenes TaxID=548 RepID=UPI0018669262|nr:contact-dependent growth inhibition system immunity protein [Klebsiella aerogenes]
MCRTCGIHYVNGTITISPTCREKLEGWSRTKDEGIENVVLSTDNTPAEIGAGLWLALRRCKG